MKTKAQNLCVNKIVVSMFMLLFFLCSCMLFGCEEKNDNNKPLPTPTITQTTVLDMLENKSKTLYNLLNDHLPVTKEDLPSNVWWTIQYEDETNITEITARYVKQKDEQIGHIYEFNLTKNLTPDEILNNKPSFSTSSFSTSSKITYNIPTNNKNLILFDCAYLRFFEQLNLNNDDILFTYVKETSLPKDPKNTMFIFIVQTKLEQVKFDITLPKQEDFENYVSNVQDENSEDVILGQIKRTSFGKAFIDVNSQDKVA